MATTSATTTPTRKPKKHETRTIYVPADKRDVWEEAERVAGDRGDSLSAYVVEALEFYRTSIDGDESPETLAALNAAGAARLATMLKGSTT